jgi:hypothetical protein
MIPRLIQRPNPVPLVSFVVKNGSKILLAYFDSIPDPVSQIETRIRDALYSLRIVRKLARAGIRIPSSPLWRFQ